MILPVIRNLEGIVHLMDAIDLLLNRNSTGVLTEPAPAGPHRELIFQAALRAPDHGNLRPWKFLLVEGEDRNRLGKVFHQAVMEANPEATEAELNKASNSPLRAPLVVIAICKATENLPKIPVWEQQISTGCAVHQMLLAAQALGYGGMWRTGPMSRNHHVSQALQLEPDETIVGFLYLGTPGGSLKSVPTLNIGDYFALVKL